MVSSNLTVTGHTRMLGYLHLSHRSCEVAMHSRSYRGMRGSWVEEGVTSGEKEGVMNVRGGRGHECEGEEEVMNVRGGRGQEWRR